MTRTLFIALSLALAAPLVAPHIAEAAPAAAVSAETFVGEWSMIPQGPEMEAMKVTLADPIPTDEQIKAMKIDPQAEQQFLALLAERRTNPDSPAVAMARKSLDDMKKARLIVTATEMTIKGMPSMAADPTKKYSVVSFDNGILSFTNEDNNTQVNKVRFVDANTAEALGPDDKVEMIFKRVKD